MATGPFGQAVVHTLTARASGQNRINWLAAQQLATDGEGDVLSSWTQEHLPDSVMVGIPRGFIPVTLSRLGNIPPPMACRPMIHAGTLLLGGLAPTAVEPALHHCGALRIILPLLPPTRLRPAVRGTQMRLTLASLGQDLTWLLRDAGPTVPLETTRRAVLDAAGAVVTAARCEAYDPTEMTFRNMVSIRADPGDQGRMEGLARSGMLRIGVHVYQIIPFTYLRAPGGAAPPTSPPLPRYTQRSPTRPQGVDTGDTIWR